MKVLFYCLTFYPENSGYSNAFQNLIRSIVKRYNNIQIDLVTPDILNGKPEFYADNVNVIRLKYKASKNKLGFFFNSYLFAKEFNRIYKDHNYDMVFVETFEDFVFLNSLSKDIYSKLVVRVHSTFETEYMMYFPNLKYKMGKYILKYLVFNKVKYIASTNNFHNNFVQKHYLDGNLYQIANKNFFVIPNTMPYISVSTPEQRTYSIRKLKFFTLGRMDEGGYLQKGFNDLLNSLILISSQIEDRIELTIIGKGEYKKDLVKKAEQNQLGFIKFVDSLTHSETLNHLIDSDVVVLPSRYEGLSMFALEALATSNAVLFSKTGGLLDLVDNNGFLFEPQNIEDLAEKILSLVECSEEQLEEFKANSKRIFNSKFSEELTADKFYKVLQIVKADN
jgi:glycosyltransferase involved in cell wall biosynthesis